MRPRGVGGTHGELDAASIESYFGLERHSRFAACPTHVALLTAVLSRPRLQRHCQPRGRTLAYLAHDIRAGGECRQRAA